MNESNESKSKSLTTPFNEFDYTVSTIILYYYLTRNKNTTHCIISYHTIHYVLYNHEPTSTNERAREGDEREDPSRREDVFSQVFVRLIVYCH
mmetsp:Transcript_44448/g.50220  ORF Transcript_44448/g.50220 Transcript_44448/m.50220 type:complete len:93 (+) Transcript_44448:152-430(+)